jgi:hypothetical protein
VLLEYEACLWPTDHAGPIGLLPSEMRLGTEMK